jgi:hypothetical protein
LESLGPDIQAATASEDPSMRRRSVLWLIVLALSTPSFAQAGTADEPAADQFVDRVWQLLAVVEAEHIDPPSRRKLIDAGIENLADSVGVDLWVWSEEIPIELDPVATREFLRRLHDAADLHGTEQQIANAVAYLRTL